MKTDETNANPWMDEPDGEGWFELKWAHVSGTVYTGLVARIRDDLCVTWQHCPVFQKCDQVGCQYRRPTLVTPEEATAGKAVLAAMNRGGVLTVKPTGKTNYFEGDVGKCGYRAIDEYSLAELLEKLTGPKPLVWTETTGANGNTRHHSGPYMVFPKLKNDNVCWQPSGWEFQLGAVGTVELAKAACQRHHDAKSESEE